MMQPCCVGVIYPCCVSVMCPYSVGLIYLLPFVFFNDDVVKAVRSISSLKKSTSGATKYKAIILVTCSVSTNGERASLANLKLTIRSLLECS